MNENMNMEYVDKIYRYMRNGSSVEDFMTKFHINANELKGILELCKLYGKNIEIVKKGSTIVFEKNSTRSTITTKPSLISKDLIHSEFLVVSDTHFGNNRQQLHLLNEVYQEAYNRGITTVLHCGDVVDGFYTNRPESPRQQFLHGFDEQAGYVVEMYPKIEGMTTKYILGSHDETHYKNGQATVNKWLSECRKDMEFLGQDYGNVEINGVKILMDHPGGGSASSVSYQCQKRIENLESNYKPKIHLMGHYHKSYSCVYRNVRGLEVPAFCDTTQFQQKKGLGNYIGAYFINMWSDKKGHIQYFEPEEIVYTEKDFWDEAGKDKNKVKQLVIK